MFGSRRHHRDISEEMLNPRWRPASGNGPTIVIAPGATEDAWRLLDEGLRFEDGEEPEVEPSVKQRASRCGREGGSQGRKRTTMFN